MENALRQRRHRDDETIEERNERVLANADRRHLHREAETIEERNERLTANAQRRVDVKRLKPTIIALNA